MKPIIDAEDLIINSKKTSYKIIDASSGPNAYHVYQEKHLLGAIFIDLNTQLADIKSDAACGGRHPLPEPSKFCITLASLGISPESHIIIYDHSNGANCAARLWWMLKSIGHEKVQVINGGFNQAEINGFPISNSVEAIQPSSYNAKSWLWPLVDIEQVACASENLDYTIIDVRDNYRFIGASEPIDLVAGHIPNAINIPYSKNLDSEGKFLSKEALKKIYNNLFTQKDENKIIVHCGSGVTTCHTILALAHAGFTIPSLYIGSWSEWSRSGRAIAREV